MAEMKIIRGTTHCSPREAGYYQENLDRLDEHFIRLIEDKKIQCASYLLARRGKIFAHSYMGPQTPEPESAPYSESCIRKIASMTKMFTSVAILKLLEQGKINLYDSVSKYIPEFDNPLHRPINLIHLLTHTSGMVHPDPGSMVEPYPFDWGDDEEDDKLPAISKVMKNILQGPALREPGREWMYCSSGFMVLADIVRRAGGMSYPHFIEQNILTPLGMKDSYFFLPADREKDICRTENEEIWGLKPRLPDEHCCFLGGGGLYSTTMDMWRFGQMLLNKGELDGVRILGPKTVELLQTNQLSGVSSKAWGTCQKNVEYGLGFSLSSGGLITPGCFGHEGAGRCKLMLDPKEELLSLFFVPTQIDWVPQSIVTPMPMIWAGLK